MAYDSSMGACLETLHSTCPDVVVKQTAAALVNTFPRSMSRTKSQELKVDFFHLTYSLQGLNILVWHLLILLC